MKKKCLFLIVLVVYFHGVHAQANKGFMLSQFVFEDTAGAKFNLDSLKGKTVFVDCWFPACPPCRAEMPYSKLLQTRLHQMNMDSNIVFVTISFKQSRQEWLAALKQLPMPNAIHLYSPASTYEIAMAGGNYPTYRIFNNKGILDIENAPRPSDFGKIDFVLYAVSTGETITNGMKIFETEKEINPSKKKNPLLKNFYKKMQPFLQSFKKAFLSIQ